MSYIYLLSQSDGVNSGSKFIEITIALKHQNYEAVDQKREVYFIIFEVDKLTVYYTPVRIISIYIVQIEPKKKKKKPVGYERCFMTIVRAITEHSDVCCYFFWSYILGNQRGEYLHPILNLLNIYTVFLLILIILFPFLTDNNMPV